MKRSENIENRLIPSLFLFFLVFIWQYISEMQMVEKYILPSPKDISIALFNMPDIMIHLNTTLKEAVIGFIVAIGFAIILALVMDGIAIVKKAIYPIVLISQTVPIIALAPLFVIWFGFGILPKIIVVVLVCFFPVLISLLEGFNSVDSDTINLLKSMGATKFQIFKLAKFPSSMVNFFAGLRIAATYSIMGAIIGEWLGGEAGLGVYMIRYKHSYALDKVFAIILIIIILSLILFKGITIFQALLMPWETKKNS